MPDHSISRRDFTRAGTITAGALAASRQAGAHKAGADIKLGLYSITYLGVWYRGDALTLEQVIQRAKEYGYHGVEIDGKRPHGDPLDLPRKRCRELRKYAQDQGIEIYAVAGNNDLSSPIPEFREAQLVYMRELLRAAADLEAKTVRVFLAWPGVTRRPEGGARYDIAKRIWSESHKDFTDEETWAWCRDGLRELSRYAADLGVTLALQNHGPVITGYRDMLRMIREVESPQLKACFDARLEHELGPDEIVRASREVGALQVLSHYGNEYEEVNGRIATKEDEQLAAQVRGLLDIGYKGYLGFELCHPLPVINGQLVGVDFADRNARLAARFLRETIAAAARA
jgi:sugar phosphate isomerase/epimerase